MTPPDRSCELHVAALPFPSHQGTQAALLHMLEARHRAGARAQLFTYGVSGYTLAPEFPWHRTRPLAAVSLRSGPSWAKLALDGRMGLQLAPLIRRTRPRVVIAHHVEAMSLTCLLRDVPRVFFAHTDLAAELPSYAAESLGLPLSAAGRALDRSLCARAHAVAAISPALAARLAALSSRTVSYVPTPWPLPERADAHERAAARSALQLAPDARVALYAGNLDAYQGADEVLHALQLMAADGGPRATLLLGTRSEPRAFLRRAVALGVPFRTAQLDGERVRRQLHAAADCAVVPRAVPGGLPMKLLDALARGLPCALMPHASAGLPLADCSVQAAGHSPHALARALADLLGQPERQRALARSARAYIAHEHSPARFAEALESVLARACGERFARSL